MGNQTPILFSNDSAEMLDKEPEQIIDVIRDAMRNSKGSKTYGITFYKRPKWYQFWKKKEWGGAHCNPIKSLRSRHNSDSSTIVFYGGTWIDLTPLAWGRTWERDDKIYLEYVEKCVKMAQRDLTELKKIIKEKKNEQE